MSDNAGKNGVQLLDRAVMLLDLVADAGSEGATLKTLCELSGLNKVTCHRILNSLVEHQLLHKIHGDKHYRLGTKLLVFGAKAARGPGLRRQFQPALERLRQQTGETVMLMARDRDDSVCIDRYDSEYQMQTLTGSVGGAVPLGLGPGSLAILSFLEPEQQQAILARNRARLDSWSMLTPERLDSWIAATLQQGYAIDSGELIPGIAGIAVPVRVAGAGVVGSLGLTFLSPRLNAEVCARYVALLQEEVAGIEPLLSPLDTRLRTSM
ncbi:IclR family transcriptional regulator [Pantoea osteomyelitidis]|uniref:IclR family transcriptional regulator n=1 Tax=Pantoea osteomyelitidis TaxID=3230026 RepID=A0ABW7PYW0_9GAMM